MDRCLLDQHEEQISGLKSELTDVSCNIATLKEDETSLKDRRSAISKTIFNTCLQIRRLLSDRAAPPSTKEAKSGIKLPKMNVPTFDGNILKWNTFWQQFDMAIHSKAQLKDAEKLAYLRDALKDCPVRNIIEGLSQDADYYKKAFGCLQRYYDRPHLIHQAHDRAIYEAPSLRDGNGRELRCLHVRCGHYTFESTQGHGL